MRGRERVREREGARTTKSLSKRNPYRTGATLLKSKITGYRPLMHTHVLSYGRFRFYRERRSRPVCALDHREEASASQAIRAERSYTGGWMGHACSTLLDLISFTKHAIFLNLNQRRPPCFIPRASGAFLHPPLLQQANGRTEPYLSL